MRKVSIIDKWEKNGEMVVECYEGVLIRDNVLMSKYKQENKLAIERSDKPFKVETDDSILETGVLAEVEIDLTEEGYELDLEELASMSLAEFTKYMKIEKWP